MDWMQIGTAILIGLMLVFLYPRVKQAMANSPKAEAGDWRAAWLPIGGVILFVILLIALVRG